MHAGVTGLHMSAVFLERTCGLSKTGPPSLGSSQAVTYGNMNMTSMFILHTGKLCPVRRTQFLTCSPTLDLLNYSSQYLLLSLAGLLFCISLITNVVHDFLFLCVAIPLHFSCLDVMCVSV